MARSFVCAKIVIIRKENVMDLSADFRYNDGVKSQSVRFCKVRGGKARLRAEYPKKGNVIFVTAAQIDLL